METYAAVLYEGTFSVGLDKKFVRIDRDGSPEKGALKLSINPALIKSPKRNYLFDAGIGEFGEDTGLDTMRENLEKHNLTEFDVTDIFISHLHYDHFGGLAHRENGYFELTFPEAKIWVSEEGWKKLLSDENGIEEDKEAFVSFLDARADLHFLKEEQEPYEDIIIRRIGGHTEFHQVLLFNDGKHKYMQAGDVIGTKGAINRKFAAKFDFAPKKSQQKREELAEMAYEEGYTIISYHEDQHPMYKLTGYDDKTGYQTENLDSYVTA